MNQLKLIKNRSDIGAGTRGADMGIDAIEIAAINSKNDFFNLYPFVDVATHNESVYDKVRNSFAKRIEHVHEQCVRVCDVVAQTLADNYFPLVLSGDHSSALGTISGIKKHFPEKTLGVVWIDAHADLHSPYTSPSGNVHGMPIAAAIADDNLSCQINSVSDGTRKYWEAMKKIGNDKVKLAPEHLVYFGVRDTEEPEDKQIEKLGIRNYKVEEMRYRGMEVCMKEAMARLHHCDMIYITFDVDSMDCDLISTGTGTPVSKGFDQYEVMEIIESVLKTDKVVGLEIAEINPLLDFRGNKMAETAFEVLDHITPVLLERLGKTEAVLS